MNEVIREYVDPMLKAFDDGFFEEIMHHDAKPHYGMINHKIRRYVWMIGGW